MESSRVYDKLRSTLRRFSTSISMDELRSALRRRRIRHELIMAVFMVALMLLCVEGINAKEEDSSLNDGPSVLEAIWMEFLRNMVILSKVYAPPLLGMTVGWLLRRVGILRTLAVIGPIIFIVGLIWSWSSLLYFAQKNLEAVAVICVVVIASLVWAYIYDRELNNLAIGFRGNAEYYHLEPLGNTIIFNIMNYCVYGALVFVIVAAFTLLPAYKEDMLLLVPQKPWLDYQFMNEHATTMPARLAGKLFAACLVMFIVKREFGLRGEVVWGMVYAYTAAMLLLLLYGAINLKDDMGD